MTTFKRQIKRRSNVFFYVCTAHEQFSDNWGTLNGLNVKRISICGIYVMTELRFGQYILCIECHCIQIAWLWNLKMAKTSNKRVTKHKICSWNHMHIQCVHINKIHFYFHSLFILLDVEEEETNERQQSKMYKSEMVEEKTYLKTQQHKK